MTGEKYRQAGGDIKSGDELVKRIKGLAASTFSGGEIGGIGGFGGLFRLDVRDYEEPVLVSAADGVGTKVKIASMCGRFDTVGQDLVAMCVNDVLTSGARPLFFLDYLAAGRMDVAMAEEVVRGVAEGCVLAGCSLLGGETAEMPGVYPEGEFDLAGFCVGIVDRRKIIDGGRIKSGDLIAGLPSSGLHSNGYSLARKVLFEEKGYAPGDYFPELGCRLGEELLRPTVIYVKQVSEFSGIDIRGMVHMTGGGWQGNIERVLPEGCSAAIDGDSWDIPPVFPFIQSRGDITGGEMYSVFNMGIGFVIICSGEDREKIPPFAKIIGKICEGNRKVEIR